MIGKNIKEILYLEYIHIIEQNKPSSFSIWDKLYISFVLPLSLKTINFFDFSYHECKPCLNYGSKKVFMR